MKYGSKCPPCSTVKGWKDQMVAQGEIKRPGRPAFLTETEEATLLKCVTNIRRNGVPIDTETLGLLAQEILSSRSEGHDQGNVGLPRGWAQSFKHRYHLTNMRCATTEKPSDTAQEVQDDNAWKKALIDTVDRLQIPPQCLLAADETSVCYLPKQKTYDIAGERRIYLSSDKRCITATPVISSNGSIVTMQLIFKGLIA